MILEEIGNLKGYQLLDSGHGFRLERFGDFVLSRPDPQALWKRSLPETEWQKADASYIKEPDAEGIDKGHWHRNSEMPERWPMHYEFLNDQQIKFLVELTPFKHTGVFPEQVSNWNFIVDRVGAFKKEGMSVLNLFGYTGIASVLCAKLGCEVTHVDASRPSMNWARENMLASGLPEDAIRWIYDDALKFVKREAKRGARYNAIILDPPAFGRGPKGEVWKFNESFPELLEALKEIVAADEDFSFIIINAYAVSVSSLFLKNMLDDLSTYLEMEDRTVDYGELIVQEHTDAEHRHGRQLSTGIFARLH